jgi:hypothetical protein
VPKSRQLSILCIWWRTGAWVPARKELQATEEEAVRALWQIADDTGR